jgi:hypothetical protein
MNKLYNALFFILMLVSFHRSNAQTVSTFENITLQEKSYLNGSDHAGGFASGNAFFVNFFDTVAGDFWTGFSISNMKDTTDKSYTNMYSVVNATGYNQSNNYAVAYQSAKVVLTGEAKGKQVLGFFVNNGTYSYSDMKNGSAFSKKFGGNNGTDSDFFKINIQAWKANGVPADTNLSFYLADYTSADSSQDYILNEWTWVNLKALNDIDSLLITFASSDTGQFGINTPTYFYMDNFTTRDLNSSVSLNELNEKAEIIVFPNPAENTLYVGGIEGIVSLQIFDLNGRLICENRKQKQIETSELTAGVYVLNIATEKGNFQKKISKY